MIFFSHRLKSLQADMLENSGKSVHVLSPMNDHLNDFSLLWLQKVPVLGDCKRQLINAACDASSHPAQDKELHHTDEKQVQHDVRGEKIQTQGVDRKAQNESLNLKFSVEIPLKYFLSFVFPIDETFASLRQLNQMFVSFIRTFITALVVIRLQIGVHFLCRHQSQVQQPAGITNCMGKKQM